MGSFSGLFVDSHVAHMFCDLEVIYDREVFSGSLVKIYFLENHFNPVGLVSEYAFRPSLIYKKFETTPLCFNGLKFLLIYRSLYFGGKKPCSSSKRRNNKNLLLFNFLVVCWWGGGGKGGGAINQNGGLPCKECT